MSSLSNKPIAWVGAIAAVVAAGVAAFVITSRHEATPAVSSASAPNSPSGAPAAGVPASIGSSSPSPASDNELPIVASRKTDPGAEYYRQGRYDLAIAFWTKAAAAGDALAAHELGVEYMDGKPWVVPRDYNKARQYHLQAAAAGDPRSMFDIGSMYEAGMGVSNVL